MLKKTIIFSLFIFVYTLSGQDINNFKDINWRNYNSINWRNYVNYTSEEWKNMSIKEKKSLFQIPVEELQKMTTDELIEASIDCFFSRRIGKFSLIDDYYKEIYNNFNGFRELIMRKNAGQKLIAYYKNIDPTLNTLSNGGLTIRQQLQIIEYLIVYSEILVQLEKNELDKLYSYLLEIYSQKLKIASYSEMYLVSNVYALARLLEEKGVFFKSNEYTGNQINILLYTGIHLSKNTRDQILNISNGLSATNETVSANTPIIYTPEGKQVTDVYLGCEGTTYTNEIALSEIEYYTLDAEIIEDATGLYNCNGYAWAKSENMGTYQMNWNFESEVDYCTDENWSNDGLPSYLSSPASVATHGNYEPHMNHSVRVIQNNYPVSSNGQRTHVSKWGGGPLVRHAPAHDVYALKDISVISHYKLKTTHQGTLLNYPKTWIGAGGITHTITNNTTTSQTLTIKTGTTVNLNGNYIKSTGSGIVQESGSTIIGLDAYVQNYFVDLIGFFPSISSAISNVGYNQTVQLLDKTYNENISFVNKYKRHLRGTSNTTINGYITITNSSYADITDFHMGNFKTITINGGYRTALSRIEYNNTNGSCLINVYNGNLNLISYIKNIGGSASWGAWNFYSTNTHGIIRNTIKGYDLAINATANSQIGLYEVIFCNNLLDLYTSSGGSIYSENITMSYPGAYMGNCTFGTVPYYCGSIAEKDNSQLAKSTNETNGNLKEVNTAFRDLLMDDDINKSLTLSEKSKSKIQSVIAKFKDAFSIELSKSEKNEVLRKLSSCYAMLEEERKFSEYVTKLISNKTVSDEMKRFLISNFVSKGDYNEALNLIDEILAYNNKSQDLEYELLYEKGTIQKYYLEESELAEKVFLDLYKKAGDHVLAKYAKAQLEDQSGLDDGNNEIDGDNSEVSKDFEISSYPNPFNPATTIEYQIPNDGFVNLVVYNTLGQVVSTLVNKHQTSGKYSVKFNANSLPSGVYFYKIENGSFTKVNKMLLLR